MNDIKVIRSRAHELKIAEPRYETQTHPKHHVTSKHYHNKTFDMGLETLPDRMQAYQVVEVCNPAEVSQV